MFSCSSQKGSASIMLALGVAVLGTFYAGAIWKQTKTQNKTVTDSLRKFGGFYNAEISAWYNQSQYDPAVEVQSPEQEERHPLPLNANYLSMDTMTTAPMMGGSTSRDSGEQDRDQERGQLRPPRSYAPDPPLYCHLANLLWMNTNLVN